MKNDQAHTAGPVKVILCAFEDKPQIRTVDLGHRTWFENLDATLNAVYRYGQNDFQPKPMRSVSMGDVIVLDSNDKRRKAFWIVSLIGFRKVQARTLRKYFAISRFDRGRKMFGWA